MSLPHSESLLSLRSLLILPSTLILVGLLHHLQSCVQLLNYLDYHSLKTLGKSDWDVSITILTIEDINLTDNIRGEALVELHLDSLSQIIPEVHLEIHLDNLILLSSLSLLREEYVLGLFDQSGQ